MLTGPRAIPLAMNQREDPQRESSWNEQPEVVDRIRGSAKHREKQKVNPNNYWNCLKHTRLLVF